MTSINNISLKKLKYKQINTNLSSIVTNFVGILLLLAMILLLINPSKYTKSILSGSSLFYNSVMPSLLPFFFISKILFAIGATEPLIKVCQKPITKIYKSPPVTSYVFIMSIICGYPVGAKLIGDLYENNQIDTNDAKKILCLASTSGPIFIIGSVGAGLFNNSTLGLYIFICHLLTALISGFILTRKFPKLKTTVNTYSKSKQNTNILSESVYSTIISILTVAVYISVFYMFIDMAYDVKILGFLSGGLNKLFGRNGIDTTITNSICSGIIEMTRGLAELSNCTNIKLKLIISTALISFGGLSVFIQSITFLSRTKIKQTYLLKVKFVQTVVGIIVSTLFSVIFL